ncbi:MAG: arginase [Pseudomonadota bacterium]
MKDLEIRLVGAPVNEGAGQPGCLMGPASLRTAGLGQALGALGYRVADWGDVAADDLGALAHQNEAIHDLAACAGWVSALSRRAYEAAGENAVPIFMGGDHLMSAGTVAGAARRAEERGRPLFVLWLDAHTDFHNLETTESGNLHGSPVAYFTGDNGFEGYFPKAAACVSPENICMLGIRSVDGVEKARISDAAITVNDMRAIDENGISRLLAPFLERVRAANGLLHVSLDVDFLEPDIAPGVGTTVPGGITFREAHLVMEMVHDSKLLSSMDLAELNPFLDERGRTAQLLVDLTSSAFGKTVIERPTKSY